MWKGDYGFFDYKYNIADYHGQDYMSPIQYIMTGIGILAIIILLIIFRKTKKETSKKMLTILGIVFTLLYIGKTTWESYWDIKTSGEFNKYILPFDTCSIFMWALLIAGLAKKDSFLERIGATFLSTIGFAGGVANAIFLRGLNYYPMFSFGGLYSFIWHMAMLFAAFYIPVTGFIKFKFKDVFVSMILLLVAALYVVPFNYIEGYDFMQLNGAGGVPIIEGIASDLINGGNRFLATLLMIVAYFAVCVLMVSIYKGVGFIKSKIKKN